jgi:hypothetical protein
LATVAAVGLGHNGNHGHCGTYYEDIDGKIKLLHFAWHRQLRSEAPSHFYRDFERVLAPREQHAYSNHCRLISKNPQSKALRYAVTRTDEFLPDGSLKIDQPGAGFSCATFVKVIAEGVGFPLIVSCTWPEGDNADREWLRRVVDFMASQPEHKNPEDQAHFHAVDSACGWSRYRPEQIAYAASLSPPPAPYDAVRNHASELMKAVIDDLPSLHTRQETP